MRKTQLYFFAVIQWHAGVRLDFFVVCLFKNDTVVKHQRKLCCHLEIRDDMQYLKEVNWVPVKSIMS